MSKFKPVSDDLKYQIIASLLNKFNNGRPFTLSTVALDQMVKEKILERQKTSNGFVYHITQPGMTWYESQQKIRNNIL